MARDTDYVTAVYFWISSQRQPPFTDHTGLMDRRQQKTLLIDPGSRTRVWCKRCGAELKDATSRQRQLGPECDPEPRTGDGSRHDVDQDPIPGL